MKQLLLLHVALLLLLLLHVTFLLLHDGQKLIQLRWRLHQWLLLAGSPPHTNAAVCSHRLAILLLLLLLWHTGVGWLDLMTDGAFQMLLGSSSTSRQMMICRDSLVTCRQ
jgi:hypothetical protein